jgi:hypothetical protein
MRILLRKFLVLLFCLQRSLSFGQSALRDAYREKNYFELQRAFNAASKTLKQADRLFYEAVLGNVFNRQLASDSAISFLRKRYSTSLNDSLRKALLNLEADNAIKSYRYQKAVVAYHMIIARCKTDSAERADLENSIALWGAIAQVPPQQIIQRQDVILRWHKDQIGLLQLPVSHLADTCDLVFDTGANISVITQSSAKKLHMRVYPVKLDLGAGTTGQTVQSSLAVADSLWLGPILLKQVVFLLLPDEMLQFKQANYRQTGIIGEPLMAQLKQMTFYGDGRLAIPLHPVHSGNPNLAMDGAMPIVEYEFNGQRLPFRFDSGASTSVLYAPFYRRFESLVKTKGRAYQMRTGGVGGTINTAAAFKLPDLAFQVSGKTFTLPELSVRTTAVGSEPDMFYGNMGLDLFGKFQQLTIDFTAMKLTVN